MALVDVRRAYFYAPARRKVFVELPPEDYQPGDERICGLLRYSLYGTRDAAQNWEEELASTLSGFGLTRRSACPCVWRGRVKRKDLEKSGRILNRVIEWDRDGITIEADQRHVREIMKGLELERANHSATPCDVARRDESKGENRCR